MAFDTFYGNTSLKDSISRQIYTGTLSHAIILEGEEGLGKKTFAKLIAAALLCSESEKPCLECVNCKNVLKNNHPDVLFYETEKHTAGNFKIETVRQIRELAYIMPNQADKKVFILAEADLMNTAAQNALLKILEEPPKYAYFILLASRKSAFLETILSRSTVYSLMPVSEEQAVNAVSELLSGPTEEEIEKTVKLVGGNIGAVIAGLKGNELLRASEKAIEIANAVCENYEFELLKALAEFEAAGSKALLLKTAEALKGVFRDALALRSGSDVLMQINAECANRLCSLFTKKQLFALMEVSEELKRRLAKNMNQKLLITWLSAALKKAVEY